MTARRMERSDFSSPSPVVAVDAAMLAEEEALGDLKLYRVPEPVTVSAKSLKQIAFLDQDEVEGRLLYQSHCEPLAMRFPTWLRPCCSLP